MRFLFREEDVGSKYYNLKEWIINAYFTVCDKYYLDPWFDETAPITKANFNMALDLLKDLEVME